MMKSLGLIVAVLFVVCPPPTHVMPQGGIHLVSEDSFDPYWDLKIKPNGPVLLGQTANVVGSYHEGIEAGSGSIMSRHNGRVLGTVRPDGTCRLVCIQERAEALSFTGSHPTRVSVLTGKIVKKGKIWLLEGFKENPAAAAKIQSAITSALK